MTGLSYDAGALIAAERRDRELWARHAQALARGVRPTVAAGVLAQAWRGGPQPLLSRLLDGCAIEPLDEPLARLAGSACARARSADVVDASVVVSALIKGEVVVTSDRDDLDRVAQALGRSLVTIPI